MRPTHSLLLVFAAALSSCATTVGTSFPPPPGTRGNGYPGLTRPQGDVATVFILDGRPKSESGYICAVNGVPAAKSGGCASVVYLLPGAYNLTIRYQSAIEQGTTDFPLGVEAKKVYQLNATSFRTRNRGMVSLLTVQDGHRVTHRNIAPGLFVGAMLDQEIPYGPSE
jgi:hypothetical protein